MQTIRVMGRLCLGAFLLLLLLPGASLFSQDQQKPDISVDVKLVNVLATVRNKKGDIVRNLTKDDFVLEEDGRPKRFNISPKNRTFR